LPPEKAIDGHAALPGDRWRTYWPRRTGFSLHCSIHRYPQRHSRWKVVALRERAVAIEVDPNLVPGSAS
jgi:hypothetical protein